MPNSLNITEMDTAPPDPWAIGTGNSPPARKLASFRLGDEIGFGEALEQTFGLKRLDHHAEIQLLVEEEEVQEIAERDLPR
jgi:hypothetical protein